MKKLIACLCLCLGMMTQVALAANDVVKLDTTNEYGLQLCTDDMGCLRFSEGDLTIEDENKLMISYDQDQDPMYVGNVDTNGFVNFLYNAKVKSKRYTKLEAGLDYGIIGGLIPTPYAYFNTVLKLEIKFRDIGKKMKITGIILEKEDTSTWVDSVELK